MDGTDLRALRHALHGHPEVGLDLPRTQQRVLDELAGAGLEITTGRGLSSVVAVLRGGAAPGRTRAARPTVLLRADMDGLPVEEATGLPWASANGAMHACGHDLHMAMLIGAVHRLAARRAELAGDVVFMFQPGEEGYDGARTMLAEGVLEAGGRVPDAALGLHVFSYGLDHGRFGFRAGPILSAADTFDVTFRGRGGHGSAPHLARDPIPAMAEFLPLLQTAVTRELSMFDQVVVTVGAVRAGDRRNVIPDTALVRGTTRTFDEEARGRVERLMTRVANGVAAANGVSAEVDYRHGAPATVSAPGEAELGLGVARGLPGPGTAVVLDRPFTVSEDFAWVLQRVPGLFVLLGACPPDADPATAAANHSPFAVYDDAVLGRGADFEAAWAAARLERAAARLPREAA